MRNTHLLVLFIALLYQLISFPVSAIPFIFETDSNNNFPFNFHERAEVHVTKRNVDINSVESMSNNILDNYEYDVKLKVMDSTHRLKLKLPGYLLFPLQFY